MLEIDRDAALVAAGRQMIDAVAGDEMIGDRPVALKRTFDRLDRDDVGAEVGERLCRQRAREVVIEAEDLDAVEQVHPFTPNLGSRVWRTAPCQIETLDQRARG